MQLPVSAASHILHAHEKVVRVLAEVVSEVFDGGRVSEALLRLRDDWLETNVNSGDFVHLVFPAGWEAQADHVGCVPCALEDRGLSCA
jgi:hypothetical protein